MKKVPKEDHDLLYESLLRLETVEECRQFMEDLGLAESGLDKLIEASYRTLGLMSFLTSGEDETRAWCWPGSSPTAREPP